MRLINLILLGGLFIGNVQAHDPFDRTQRQISAEKGVHRDSHEFICRQPMLAADIPLKELKLVGTVIFKASALALFTDRQNEVFSVPQRAQFAAEGFQIEKITKDRIVVARQIGSQCTQTETQEIRF